MDQPYLFTSLAETQRTNCDEGCSFSHLRTRTHDFNSRRIILRVRSGRVYREVDRIDGAIVKSTFINGSSPLSRRLHMPTYLIQSQWTDQGIRNVKESAKRLDLGKKKLKEMGGEIKAFYLTTGSYDMLAVVDVPNDATLAAHLLWLGSQGNLRTQTVKAFTEDEFRTIVGELS